MENKERMTVRLSVETVVALKALVDQGDFESVSHAVTEAIERLVAEKFDSEELSLIISDISEEDLEDIIDEKQIDSMDEAIRNAVTEYVRAKMKPEDQD